MLTVVTRLEAQMVLMYKLATQITAIVMHPGSNDMPGRLLFSTTADGASSPTAEFEEFRASFFNGAGSSDATVLRITGKLGRLLLEIL